MTAAQAQDAPPARRAKPATKTAEKNLSVVTLDDTPPPAIAPSADDKMMVMLQNVIADPTISLERVDQAFALYEKIEGRHARKAFDAAMAAAKAAIPVINKNKHVAFGDTAYDHEDMAEIARTVDPILAGQGLSYRFRVSSKVGEPVSVTCVITHVAGHFEETTLTSGRDESGKKNAIQSIGSALTYLQRYSLKAALGLAAAKDDDGAKSEKTADDLATIDEAQAKEIRGLIDRSKSNVGAFLAMANAESVGDILAKDFEGLKLVLMAKLNNGAAK